VILAGGTGERLKPLTNSIPKALAPVNGVPIIKQQIDNFIALGIREIFILTGYRSNMIQNYLSYVQVDNLVSIKIIETPTNYSPAERLLRSALDIGNEFILAYCDNLVSDLNSIRLVLESRAPITFLVELRTSGNVSIELRAIYNQERTQKTPYVELGFSHILCDTFFESLMRSQSLQATLHEISSNSDCRAVVTENSLSSVSDMNRYNLLRKERKTILIDRDGVLNHKMPHRTYLSDFRDYKPLELTINELSSCFKNDTDFIIITNQPGIATKEIDPNFLDALHSKMIVELILKQISVIGLYVCIHHWEDNCECRKPKPGMIKTAIFDYALNPSKLVYIGDEQKDVDAAIAGGILGVRISDELSQFSYKSIAEANKVLQERITL
jgi:D-glycero-D-manno-heptose 1,7-bisphosphate phosphatase